MTRSLPSTLLLQCAIFVVLAGLAGASRQWLPNGIQWNGKWPVSGTSAEDAYKMMARPDDPAFVSLQEVIQHQEKKTAVLLDARASAEYVAGRIPGARQLPYYEMDKFQAQALEGITAETPLIIYCEGIGCELSFFLGRELKTAGYNNIQIFYGGYPEWKDAGLPIEQ